MSTSTAIADSRLRRTGLRISGMPAGELAARDLDVPFQVRLGCEHLRVPVSPGNSAISSRTVMNTVG